MSDTELVRQARAGRAEAYAELACRWAQRVTALCHARIRRADVADDLAQEALLRGFRSLHTLADPERFGAWLRGIALRVCLDWLKSKQNLQVSFCALEDGGRSEETFCSHQPSAGDLAGDADEVRQLMKAVEELPEQYRTVILLYYYEDVTYQELAILLGVSAATVNARLTKARALLRDRLTNCRR
jgi:RNA polymerase sigma-70 factor (ECF subfamily)